MRTANPYTQWSTEQIIARIAKMQRAGQWNADHSDTCFDLIQALVWDIEDRCKGDISGLGDWVYNGQYTGNETAEEIIAEWNSYDDEDYDDEDYDDEDYDDED